MATKVYLVMAMIDGVLDAIDSVMSFCGIDWSSNSWYATFALICIGIWAVVSIVFLGIFWFGKRKILVLSPLANLVPAVIAAILGLLAAGHLASATKVLSDQWVVAAINGVNFLYSIGYVILNLWLWRLVNQKV